MGGLCRNCTDALGELVGHEETESGRLLHVFECPNCEHRWTYSVS